MRPPREIVQRDHAFHHRRQRFGNCRLAHVGHVLFAFYREPVHFCVKRVAHLRHGSVELNHIPPGGNLSNLKPLPCQPVRHRLHVGICRPELLPKLFRRQPRVIICRTLRLLLVQQLPQRGLLFCASLQQQQHPCHRLCVANRSSVELRSRQRMDIALQFHSTRVVHLRGDSRWHSRLCVHRLPAQQKQQSCCDSCTQHPSHDSHVSDLLLILIFRNNPVARQESRTQGPHLPGERFVRFSHSQMRGPGKRFATRREFDLKITSLDL